MGNQFFSKVQYGKETKTTKGTAVAATSIWPGTALKVQSDKKVEFPDEQFNVRVAARRAIPGVPLYTDTLVAPYAGFQQLLLPFNCGLKGDITPTETTPAQSDYAWVFTPGLTVAAGSNTPDSCTLQLGDDAQGYRIPYAMFDRINIKGTIPQGGGADPVALSAGFFGRLIEQNAFTAALSEKSSTPMHAKMARLYVNSSWATVGTTEYANLLREFQIEILTGVHPDDTGFNLNCFNAHKEGVIGCTATFTIEGGAAAAAALLSQQAGDLMVARLTIPGPVIGTGVAHSLTIDIGGAWETVSPIDKDDRGDNLATLVLHGIYDDAGAKMLQATVVTNTATI